MKWNWRVIGAAMVACGFVLFMLWLQVYPAERNNTGNMLFSQGQNDAAIQAYQVAQVNAPDQPEAYYNVAGPLSGMGRLRDALAALEQALKTADETLITKVFYNLGNVYFELAQYDRAVEVYREVLIRDPLDSDARHNYELALLRQLPSPTPTLQEQQTNPEEDEIDPTVTPTSNPAGQDGPTPTPPPESLPDPTQPPDSGFVGDLENSLPTSPTPMPGGSLSVEAIERQFDAIQENQQTLREFLLSAATPAPPNGKDW